MLMFDVHSWVVVLYSFMFIFSFNKFKNSSLRYYETLEKKSPFFLCVCVIVSLASECNHKHRSRLKPWNNCGSGPWFWELCIICLTFTTFGLLF